MSEADPRTTFQLRQNVDYFHFVDGQLSRLAIDEGLLFLRGDNWTTSADPHQEPWEAIAAVRYGYAERTESLVRLPGAVAHIIRTELAINARVAAGSMAACDAALATIKQALPVAEPDENDTEVPVSFRWFHNQPQGMARLVPAPRWADIDANYSARTQSGLGSLMSWAPAPPAGGRLLLWHGAPGTGKTTAIRALARRWRRWADFEFITDPEQFLQNPSYLLTTIADSAKRKPCHPGPDRWRVIVLEDAGEYLAPDAQMRAGQALSRLLNVCDGVLGQATRCLVLVTTNEPLPTLHPALSRPGRCLSQIEFHELGREEIGRWCAGRSIEPPTARSATLAELFAHAEGRGVVSGGSGFGFAAAAA